MAKIALSVVYPESKWVHVRIDTELDPGAG